MVSLVSVPAPRIQGLAGQFLYAPTLSHYFIVISAFQVVGGLFLILSQKGYVPPVDFVVSLSDGMNRTPIASPLA